MDRETGGDTNCNWHAQYSHEQVCTETERLGN